MTNKLMGKEILMQEGQRNNNVYILAAAIQ